MPTPSPDHTDPTPAPATLPAQLPRRLMAMLYDSMLVFGLLFSATFAYAWVVGALASETISDEQVVHQIEPAATGWLFQFYLLLTTLAFFTWFWRKLGQTLGMQAWRLKVVGVKQDRVSLGQCLLRFFGAMISALCLGAGYWWLLFDKQKLTWHDRWSNTRVVVLPKRKR